MDRNFNIEIFDDIDILKELVKTWNIFLNFRISCVRLKNSEYLLSILSSMVNNNYSYNDFNLVSSNIISEYNSRHTEFSLMNKYIDEDYNNEVLSTIISTLESEEVHIGSNYNDDIEYIDNLDLDPILKLMVFQRMSYRYLKEYKSCVNIFRIIFNLYSHRIKLLDKPIIYPDVFFQINMVEHVSKQSTIAYLKFLSDICLYGMETINFVSDNLNILKKQLEKNKNFRYLIKSNSFFIILINPCLKIVDLMALFNWKRDKAARLLSKLRDDGLFLEIKIKKEKLYINKYIIDLFSEGRHRKPEDFVLNKFTILR